MKFKILIFLSLIGLSSGLAQISKTLDQNIMSKKDSITIKTFDKDNGALNLVFSLTG